LIYSALIVKALGMLIKRETETRQTACVCHLLRQASQ